MGVNGTTGFLTEITVTDKYQSLIVFKQLLNSEFLVSKYFLYI